MRHITGLTSKLTRYSPAMEVTHPHQLDLAEAQARLRVLGEYLQKKHGIAVTWKDDTHALFNGRYMVVKIEGTLSVEPQTVRFRGEDPGMLWRKKASAYIEDKLTKYLDPRITIDQLPRGA